MHVSLRPITFTIDNFIPRRRQVNFDPSRPRRPYRSPEQQFEPRRPKRRWPKILAGLLAFLIILSGLLALAAFVYLKKTPLAGEMSGRINILVMGVDNAATLSDTLMLVSLDTRDPEVPGAAMISIPRDLWVEIPGYGDSKINAAYSYGQNDSFPGGGPALMKKTVAATFDVPIHYYAAVDFAGFEQLIDAVGGVDVDVKEDIYDPYFPDGSDGYEVYSIEAGRQHLSGNQALKYARSRMTTTDFDRSARQQQVLVALKDKLLRSQTLTNKKVLEELFELSREHVVTDIGPREALRLGEYAQRITAGNTIKHVLSSDPDSYLEAYEVYGYVLLPRDGDFTEVNRFIDQIFGSPSAQ